MDQKQFNQFLSRPLIIRGRTVKPRLILAPMAGLGHVAMRQLISEYGGYGLLFTGMCSARAVPHENPNVSLVFRWRKAELPYLVCQLFGSDPEDMARAAKRVENEGFFGVDLNFGCSVSAITKKGSGAALLKAPQTAARIVQAVREAVSIPLFVKFRTGWENNPSFAAQMAKTFETAGADALIFHPRVAPDRRNRPPQWDIIKCVCDTVKIPVFGNGNLFEPKDAKQMLRVAQCDGLCVGRMAIARPWLFAEWTGTMAVHPNIYYKACSRYIRILSAHFDDFFAVKFFKKFLPYYCANFKFGHQIHKRLMVCTTMEEAKRNLDQIFENPPETTDRPNQHLFTR